MKLSYHLIPGRSSDLSSINSLELHNRAFGFWREQWDQVLTSLDGTKTEAGDFTRQDVIAAICDEEQILALHLYSLFRLDSAADQNHHYFNSSFEPAFIARMRDEGFKKVMSMEYLTVSPEVRRSSALRETKLSLAHVIMGLGTHMQRALGADAAIGPCRCDVKVDKLAQEFGAFVGEQREMHNVQVVSAAIPSQGIVSCNRLPERREIDRLWRERTDYRKSVVDNVAAVHRREEYQTHKTSKAA